MKNCLVSVGPDDGIRSEFSVSDGIFAIAEIKQRTACRQRWAFTDDNFTDYRRPIAQKSFDLSITDIAGGTKKENTQKKKTQTEKQLPTSLAKRKQVELTG